MEIEKFHIGIIGSGNVAFHLVKAFNDFGIIPFIFARNKSSLNEIEHKFEVNTVNIKEELTNECDFIILTVSDDAIEPVANSLVKSDKIIVHTSGVASMQRIKNATPNFGSFYPLQSVNKTREVDFKTVPLLYDASNESTKNIILRVASWISDKPVFIKDEDRAKIHPAAVMVNNFSNHFYALAKDYAESKGLDFSLLHPLMIETAKKAVALNPKDVQTGPARRKDEKSIQQHLEFIEDENLKELYLRLTESIKAYYK